MVETPVLYITFARPEYASLSFAAIKMAKPKKLYFYSNKARCERPDEVARNEEVRSYLQQIDWDCDVKTWFREEYVDVFTSLRGAIDWLFKNEDKGIVIEEDVVASLAFFDYIDKTIDTCARRDDIWLISGNNAQPQYFPKGYSCCLSRWADIYGWASWRDKWNSVDWNMKQWPKYKGSKEQKSYWGYWPMYYFMNKFYTKFYHRITTSDYKPWDSIFLFTMRYNKGYCLQPYTNMSKDIGIVGENHGQGTLSPFSNFGTDEEVFCIEGYPPLFSPSREYDKKLFYKHILKGVFERKVRKFFHF